MAAKVPKIDIPEMKDLQVKEEPGRISVRPRGGPPKLTFPTEEDAADSEDEGRLLMQRKAPTTPKTSKEKESFW